MEQISWTNSDIRKLFKMEGRYKSIQTLYNAEERRNTSCRERAKRESLNQNLGFRATSANWKEIWFSKKPIRTKNIMHLYAKRRSL